MSETLDLSSSGILIGDGTNRARDLSSIYQPSENQIFILDTDFKSADQKFIVRLPISFQIDYKSQKITNPPDLFLLINPSNLNFSSNKKINSEFARGGYITEEWGDMQETLEFSGKIGGYYVWNPKVDFSGLNRYDRSKSPSFRNLMNLLMVYRNNGMLYDDTPLKPIPSKTDNLIQNKNILKTSKRVSQIARSRKNRIIAVGDVYLNYDGTSYRGSFDSFSIEEKADEPYTLSYNFSFTVRDKSVSDKRNIQNSSNNNPTLEDKDKNSLSTQQVKNLDRISSNNLRTNQSLISEQNNDSTSTDDSLKVLLGGGPVKYTLTEQLSFLTAQGNILDNEDVLKLEKNISDMNSNEFNKSRQGYADSIVTHSNIISKNNNNGSVSENGDKAINYSQKLSNNLQKNNKAIK